MDTHMNVATSPLLGQRERHTKKTIISRSGFNLVDVPLPACSLYLAGRPKRRVRFLVPRSTPYNLDDGERASKRRRLI